MEVAACLDVAPECKGTGARCTEGVNPQPHRVNRQSSQHRDKRPTLCGTAKYCCGDSKREIDARLALHPFIELGAELRRELAVNARPRVERTAHQVMRWRQHGVELLLGRVC